MADLIRVPGTICLKPSEKWRHIFNVDQRGYAVIYAPDLRQTLEDSFAKGWGRVVWIEARAQIKSFHPCATIREVRAAAADITFAGLGLTSVQAYSAFRQGVLPL